ncbi:MAG TPA: DUF1801 domain-containing protein, partial [Myxococcota bacterium]|nr:DUF1801 domain-containing protein [Myxococcota bacterium]
GACSTAPTAPAAALRGRDLPFVPDHRGDLILAENKTRPTGASVADHLAGIPENQRADAQLLVELMTRLTGEPPVMWGPTIVGFGSYHYRYASGHEGDMPLAAFASRQRELVVYLLFEGQSAALLPKLGRHRKTKSCLYIRQLAEVRLDILEALIQDSIVETKRLYPG